MSHAVVPLERLVLLGKCHDAVSLGVLMALAEEYVVSLVASLRQIPLEEQPIVVLLADSPERIAQSAAWLQQRKLVWLVWNLFDDPLVNVAAYSAGAALVLAAQTSAVVLGQALAVLAAQRVHPKAQRRLFARGSVIHVEPEQVLLVEQGVVAQSMVHADGAEVLLGLYGARQVILGHAEDDCAIQFRAHTELQAELRDWADLAGEPQVFERLRARIVLMEAWAAAQARPYLDLRVLGILSVLGDQFGLAHSHGLLLDVRLTHSQLALAVGATRSTITRILGSLRTQGLVCTVGQGEQERFCLCGREQFEHALC